MSATADRAENIFLTPRVIDQNAFDDLAGTLRGLIDQAEHAGRELDKCVDEAGSANRDQAKSAEQLQERLRLGARMLKAFQSQIVRTESVIAELAAQEEKTRVVEQAAEKSVASSRQRIEALANDAVEAALERFSQQMEDRIAAALERLDNQINARTERMQSVAAEVDSLMPAVNRLTEVAEAAEMMVVSMAHHGARLMIELDERSKSAEDLIGRSESTSKQLEDDLHEAAKQVDTMSEQGGRLADRLESACERGEAVKAEVLQQIETAHAASRELAIDVQACEALETLIEELKPWRALVVDSNERCGGDAVGQDGEIELPEPAARLVDELRARLDRDLKAFSSVLAHIAEQFQAFASRDHVRREVRELDAREDRGGSNAVPAPDGGDEGVVSVIRPASPLSFSSHARQVPAE